MPTPIEAYRAGYEKARQDDLGGTLAEVTMGMLRDDPGGHFAAGYHDGAARKKFNPPSTPTPRRPQTDRLIPKFSENPFGWFLGVIIVVEFWALWQLIKAPFQLIGALTRSEKPPVWVIVKNVIVAGLVIGLLWLSHTTPQGSVGSFRISAANPAVSAGPVSQNSVSQVPPAAAPQNNNGFWLDRPLSNWNTPGLSIPAPPNRQDSAPPECSETVRPAATAEQQDILRAGWKLQQRPPEQEGFGSTSIFSAYSGSDGMCRALGEQYFVFLAGRFAGTISPVPMDSRGDGGAGIVRFINPTMFTVDFTRYGPQDPACCPSGAVRVTYSIEAGSGGPLLIPKSVQKLP